MKVKVLYGAGRRNGQTVNAKRFKDMTDEEVEASISYRGIWEPDCIFIEPEEDCDSWEYMFDDEVEVIEE